MKKLLALFMVAALVLVGVANVDTTVSAADKTAQMTAAVKKSVGKAYPLGTSKKKYSRRAYGVFVSDFESYTGYEKITGSGSNKAEYIVFVAKAKSSAKAKSAKDEFKSYISEEGQSMNSYLSADGKKAFKAAQIGCSGSYVWIVMASPTASVNKTAVSAMKKKM